MTARERSLVELAERVGGEVVGDGATRIGAVRGLADAGPGDLAFYSNPKYAKQYQSTRAGAVLVRPDEDPRDGGPALIRVKEPYLAFAKISWLYHPPPRGEPGRAAEAFVHPTAEVEPTARIMPRAYVGPGARVGARTILHPGAHLGEGARVGEDCIVYPNVTVRERCLIGNRVILQPGAVIGSDGFGFAFDPEGEGKGPRHFKVPQAGIVRIEDDVEVGACTTIDRATMGETVIGRGTKIDNLVQIAHNVEVGPLCLLVSQAGVAGSSRLGAGVVLAGQVGVIGHITIGDGAIVGAQSGIGRDLQPGERVSGSPAFDHRDWLKSVGSFAKLPDLIREVRQLRRRLDELEKGQT
jgi:UDP-3-O-[3-hydroxymyristoyl] glucosamine N-acyltransferase